MQTHEQRLAAYLEHARGEYTDDAVQELEASARAQDARAASMDAEQRSSYQDLYDLIGTALAEKFPAPADSDGYSYWGYLVDFGDDWAVFSQKGVKYQVSYSLDGTTVTLGDKQPVREITTYVPVESKSSNYAVAKRAFSSVIERPPPHVVEVAVRMDEETDPNVAHFAGYASTTDSAYAVRDWLGEYDETIRAGAFAKTLRERPDVPMLRNHDPNYVLANTSSGTSLLGEDGGGLRNEADFDRRQTYVNDLCISLQRGDVSKMSFSFAAVKDTWNDAYDQRSVSELKLYDTSVVTYPANPATSAELVDGMRSALGREGRSLWLADGEMSMRGALTLLQARSSRRDDGSFAGVAWADDEADVLEKAMRALVHADEVLCRSHGPHGRARTFYVASALLELRAGKTLSAKNQVLLQTAADALSSADRHHSTASDALNTVLSAGTGDGADGNQGAETGNTVSPQDGAGPRSARSIRLHREREAELRALRRP